MIAAGLLKFPPNGAAKRPATSGTKPVMTRAPLVTERDRGCAHMGGEELWNINRVTGKHAEHKEPVDDEQIREGHHAVHGQEQDEAGD
jgi:hypothetical protein